MSFRMPASLRLTLVPALLLALSSVASAGRCPNTLFVVDKSSSMNADPSGGAKVPSKWQLARTAINLTMGQFRTRIPFGLEIFGHDTGTSPQQCYSQTMVQQVPDHNAWAIIENLMNANNPNPNTDTNTGEAIKRAMVDGMLNDGSRGNFIVLITDGDPNCNSGDNGLPSYTLSQITAAANADPPVHTFVVGFDASGGVNPDNLNAMAIAGLEPQAGCMPNAKVHPVPCYYSASSGEKFKLAVNAIINGLVGGSKIGGCDDSCFALGCMPDDQGAPTICHFKMPGGDPSCVVDECAVLTCGDGQYCTVAGGHGACFTPCPPCADNEYCVGGTCQTNKCAGQVVGATQYCDPAVGNPVGDKCQGAVVSCPLPQFCNPATGFCDEDPCRTVNCPTGSSCSLGWCQQDAPPGDMAVPLDMATAVQPPTVDNGGGCSLGAGGATRGAGLPLALLGLLGLLARRRRGA